MTLKVSEEEGHFLMVLDANSCQELERISELAILGNTMRSEAKNEAAEASGKPLFDTDAFCCVSARVTQLRLDQVVVVLAGRTLGRENSSLCGRTF